MTNIRNRIERIKEQAEKINNLTERKAFERRNNLSLWEEKLQREVKK
jgi:hypothetical protein